MKETAAQVISTLKKKSNAIKIAMLLSKSDKETESYQFSLTLAVIHLKGNHIFNDSEMPRLHCTTNKKN
jgi:hypothetical protein